MAEAERQVRIRDYRPGDEIAILALMNRVFPEVDEHFDPRSLTRWRWQYRDSPFGRRIILAESEAGEIVGHFGGRAARARVLGRPGSCSEGVDTCVDARYRSSGLFVQMGEAYSERFGEEGEDDFIYGGPNEYALPIGMKYLHYRRVFSPLPWLDRPVATSDRSHPRPLSVTASLDERLDRLWSRCEMVTGIERNLTYWRWRYLERPSVKYECHRVEADGEWRGAAIVRHYWLQAPITVIADWIVPPDDEEAENALLDSIELGAMRAGTKLLRAAFNPNGDAFSSFVKRGFVPGRSHLHWIVRLYDPDLSLQRFRRTWYFTLGDSDIV